MGYPFPGMGDLGLDTTHLAATLGCQWRSAVRRGLQSARQKVQAIEDVAQLVAGVPRELRFGRRPDG